MNSDSMKLMNTPRTLELVITNECNQRCKYCSHFSTTGSSENDLDTGEWLRFLEELSSCAVMDVSIGGGEPFMRDDIEEIINGIASRRMRFSILSNGTVITNREARFVASTGRCNCVQVSIDGSHKEAHDVFRGAGTFEKAVSGARSLQRYGVPMSVRSTIHRHNYKDLANTAKFMFEDLGLNSFSTNSVAYLGLCRENSDQLQLSVDEYSETMEILDVLNERYKGRITAVAGPLATLYMWRIMETARKSGSPPFTDGGYLRACNGVFSKLAVRADGVFVPCVQLADVELGRINEDSIEDVWQSSEKLLKLRERRSIPLDSFEFCRGCDYLPYCCGNCPGIAYTRFGEFNHPSPDSCLRLFLESGGRLPSSKGNAS